MFGTRQRSYQSPAAYATEADVYQFFEKDMDRLYTLSLLLTADYYLAERCFVGGLDDASDGNCVFRDWLQSWATRTVIQNAIRLMQPRPGDGLTTHGEALTNLPAELAAVSELPAFDRFAFVLSVLERYSDRECAVLLKCTGADVFAARSRALRCLGHAAELRDPQLGSGLPGPVAFSAHN